MNDVRADRKERVVHPYVPHQSPTLLLLHRSNSITASDPDQEAE